MFTKSPISCKFFLSGFFPFLLNKFCNYHTKSSISKSFTFKIPTGDRAGAAGVGVEGVPRRRDAGEVHRRAGRDGRRVVVEVPALERGGVAAPRGDGLRAVGEGEVMRRARRDRLELRRRRGEAGRGGRDGDAPGALAAEGEGRRARAARDRERGGRRATRRVGVEAELRPRRDGERHAHRSGRGRRVAEVVPQRQPHGGGAAPCLHALRAGREESKSIFTIKGNRIFKMLPKLKNFRQLCAPIMLGFKHLLQNSFRQLHNANV